ncbi:MAG: DUF3581 family protein [Halofilum sp. (in: g-proteobacteria)]
MTAIPDFLEAYYASDSDGGVRVSAGQASAFAKDVAGDYNPLHDVGARRFCVPGDLLCALVLGRYGLSQRMTFAFRDMVGAGEALYLPEAESETGSIAVRDTDGGVYLEVERAGSVCHDPRIIERFIRAYAAFSGKTFPHYMIPVLEEHGVMFHPDRPLVIYDGMGFELQTFEFTQPALELADRTLAVDGKRGSATLRFDMHENGHSFGAGWKKLVISGLRDFDAERMRAFVEHFRHRKAAYEAERDGG